MRFGLPPGIMRPAPFPYRLYLELLLGSPEMDRPRWRNLDTEGIN